MNTDSEIVEYDTIIIGGGPAGTGLLLKSIKDGLNNSFIKGRIALIEKTDFLIKGNITNYQINSDTLSDVFLECLQGDTNSILELIELKSEIGHIQSFTGKSIPLPKLDNYYIKLGKLLKDKLEKTGKCDFYMNTHAEKIIQKDQGEFEVSISNQNKTITAKHIVIASGGIPKSINQENFLFPNLILYEQFKNKMILSDMLLKTGIPDNLKTQLQRNSNVVILGGNHSAFSAAHFLLNSESKDFFAENSIKIYCKTKPKLYYNSSEEAIDEGYTEFTQNDICPVTNKLFRLAGLRMDGRALYIQMLGLGNSELEKRVSLNILNDNNLDFEKDLKQASIIIVAIGYAFNMLPVENCLGEKIEFKGELDNHWVNENSELLDSNKKKIPNLYAMGLGTGFIPKDELGGEPSFEGQTNGIWYYQNALAKRIIDNIEKSPR